MVYFADLSPCTEVCDANPGIVAVGWLESGHPVPFGSTPLSFYHKLVDLLRHPWLPPFASAGTHQCLLCQFDGSLGTGYLFVPAGDVIYVAPQLIIHYVAAHHYRPPHHFQSAVLSCPDQSSMAFKRLLLAAGGKSLISRSG